MLTGESSDLGEELGVEYGPAVVALEPRLAEVPPKIPMGSITLQMGASFSSSFPTLSTLCC